MEKMTDDERKAIAWHREMQEKCALPSVRRRHKRSADLIEDSIVNRQYWVEVVELLWERLDI